jgi:hypothetical protein
VATLDNAVRVVKELVKTRLVASIWQATRFDKNDSNTKFQENCNNIGLEQP